MIHLVWVNLGISNLIWRMDNGLTLTSTSACIIDYCCVSCAHGPMTSLYLGEN